MCIGRLDRQMRPGQYCGPVMAWLTASLQVFHGFVELTVPTRPKPSKQAALQPLSFPVIFSYGLWAFCTSSQPVLSDRIRILRRYFVFRFKWNILHKKTISQNGGVYDLDNSLYETDPDYFEWLDNIKYRYGSGLLWNLNG